MALSNHPSEKITCQFPLVFTDSARSALDLCFKSIAFSGKKLLLPAYIGFTEREGSGIFDPVKNNNLGYAFYPINKNLEPDLSIIDEFLQSGEFSAILVVHYFGILQADLLALRNCCDRNSVYLIEDCAHASCLIYSDFSGQLGGVGDMSVYSLHKSIAVNSGGILRVNNRDLVKPIAPKEMACPVSVVEQFALTDFKKVHQIRRDNYLKCLELLTNINGLHIPFPFLGLETPHDFPLMVSDGLREKLYFCLQEQGVPTTALYYRLIDEISPDDFPLSHFISKSILNLPIHQDITFDDIKKMSDLIRLNIARLRLEANLDK